jgi:transporter family-2 protein
MQATWLYSLIMLIVGLGIPLMATLNGTLGSKLNSPTTATVILLFTGFIIAASYLLIFEGIPDTLFAKETPWYYYCGGFFVVFYILSITWIAPRFGVSNAIAFVLLGQLIAMSIIDHYGLLGASQYTLTLKRTAGLLLMACGVFLVLSKPQSV